MITKGLTRGAVFCALATVAVLPACTVRTHTPTVDVYAASPPPDIERYPRGHWQGNTYYYYQDHWYYRSPRGWAYLREEPVELQRYRYGTPQAPPAYGRPYGYGGGPGPYVPPPLPAPRRY